MSRARSASCAAALCAALVAIPDTSHARPMTLAEAFAAAEDNPEIAAAAATVDEAEGNLDQAGTISYNPWLGLAAGPAFGPDGTAYDLEVSVGQVFELGGKRRKRSAVATAERDAAKESVAATRAAVRALVWRAFHLALVAQERVGVAIEDEAAARELAEAAKERLRLGDATQTEVNVATAGLGRAAAAVKAAERDVILARAELASAIGATGEDIEPSGTLPAFAAETTDEDALVAAALAGRHDLDALERIREARDADVALAAARARPDLELSVSWARSAVEEVDAVVVGVRIDLPLWNRNRGKRKAARAAERRAGIEVDGARRQIERDVRAAVRRYRGAIEAVAAFDRDVIGTLDENLKLARESLAAGKFDLLQLNGVRRELVDSQLSYLDALTEVIEARAALDYSTGALVEEGR